MSKSSLLFKSIVALISISFLSMNHSIGQNSQPDNDYWWPNMLSLAPLSNNSQSSSPMGE